VCVGGTSHASTGEGSRQCLIMSMLLSLKICEQMNEGSETSTRGGWARPLLPLAKALPVPDNAYVIVSEDL